MFKEVLGLSDADTETAVAKYREYYAETGLYENAVYPGIPVLLEKLSRAGKKLAVATSKVTVYTDKILERFGLSGYFSFVSGDEMDGSLTVNGKRDIIRIALEGLGAGGSISVAGVAGAAAPGQARRAVMIGDRKHDIIVASDNAIDSIGVLWGYGSRSELESAGVTMIVNIPEDITGIVI